MCKLRNPRMGLVLAIGIAGVGGGILVGFPTWIVGVVGTIAGVFLAFAMELCCEKKTPAGCRQKRKKRP